MHVDSDSQGNTVKNDHRIYSFAKNLRKFRLDELPQIINIFLGHMHLVGPRAEWIKLSNEYSESIDNYELRNIVRPGITGWAQILYQYGFDIHDSKQKLMYELYYIKNWTVWLELEICIKTITVVLDKKGF
jgi:lipopolysaccharide/colanic/teichoic acid biosynthesis glycosyltransferase